MVMDQNVRPVVTISGKSSVVVAGRRWRGLWGDLRGFERMKKTVPASEIFVMAIKESNVTVAGILKIVFVDGSEVEIDNETGEVIAHSVGH